MKYGSKFLISTTNSVLFNRWLIAESSTFAKDVQKKGYILVKIAIYPLLYW